MDLLLGTGLRLTGIGDEDSFDGFWSDDEYEDGELQPDLYPDEKKLNEEELLHWEARL